LTTLYVARPGVNDCPVRDVFTAVDIVGNYYYYYYYRFFIKD